MQPHVTAMPRQLQGRPRTPIAERFWPKVLKTETCWLWQGAHMTHGYGVLNAGGTNNIRRSTHRVSWELHNGPIPDGLAVLHKCDNPPCVNPDHLFLGTQADNLRDMSSKGRNVSQAHPERLARGDRNGSRRHPEKLARGEHNPAAKLTAESVSEIRRRYALGGVSQQELANAFGVSQPMIGNIVRGHSWRHVSD